MPELYPYDEEESNPPTESPIAPSEPCYSSQVVAAISLGVGLCCFLALCIAWFVGKQLGIVVWP